MFQDLPTNELDQDCFNCKCRRNIDPECGSDNRTYLNHCMFKCAQSRCPSLTRGVTVASKGRCDESTHIPRTGPKQDFFFKIRLHPPNNAFNNRRRFKEILILTEWSFAKCKYEIIFESSGHTDVILSDYNSSNHYQEDHKSQIIYDIRKRIQKKVITYNMASHSTLRMFFRFLKVIMETKFGNALDYII